jgi:hypothetical protein
MTRAVSGRVIALLAAITVAGCDVVGALATGHLDITQAELQARIAPRFPTHHCKLIVACVDLSNPVVVLKEGDDRIGFTADVSVALGLKEHAGRVGFSGRPRYEPQRQLFLEDLQIDTLELAGLPAEYAELVKLRGPAAAKGALQSHPLYTLDTGTAKGALAKRTVRDVKVVNGRLRVSFDGS